jgi:DUF218 domain
MPRATLPITRRLAALLVVLGVLVAHPAPAGAQARYQPLSGRSGVQDANFYLLTLLEQVAPANAAMVANARLASLGAAVRTRAREAARACVARAEARRMARQQTQAAQSAESSEPEPFPACDLNQLRWTPEEASLAAEAAARLFDQSPQIRALVSEHMRPSRYFALHESRDDRALFLQAWADAHAAIDRIIRIYGLGETPTRFADIDSIIYPVDSSAYRGLMTQLIRDIDRAAPAEASAYDMPLRLALELMFINRRDDAVRQGAMEARENAATARRLASIRWADFRYGVILVPGHSPTLAYEPLNPNAVLRMRVGVAHYRAGLAPVIVVSGGQLRPIGTTFTEALEMKRYLMSVEGIPEDAILIDPVARHTTTNMRNTVRLIDRYGIPFDRLSLVVGNSVPNIASAEFAERCRRELGYVPFAAGRRLDYDTLEFTPLALAFHRDAMDPMDP